MEQATSSKLISTSSNLQDFFHGKVQEVVDKHQIDGEDDTIWYLTQLLCSYSRTSRCFDARTDNATLTPLADYYREAIEALSDYERRQHLQRLGDMAIFVSSLFAGSLKRKPVNVSYYIGMGESAYGALADATVRNSRDKALVDIFADLSVRFADYVAALSEIPARQPDERSLLQQVTEWEKSGHPGLARQLRAQGVFLPEHSEQRH